MRVIRVIWGSIALTAMLAGCKSSQKPAPAATMSSPVASTKSSVQRADVPAPKVDKDGAPNKVFMTKHEKFVEQAKAGNIDLLFLGDSITEGWMGKGKEVWDKTYGDKNAADFGIGGDRTQHVLWRNEHGELDNIHPKVAVLMIGTNNLASNPPDQIADGIAKIVKQVREKTGAKVLLLAVFPRGKDAKSAAGQRASIAAINQQIATLDDGSNVRYLDIGDKFLEPDKSISKQIMGDYLHPTAKGYQIWADAMAPLLSEMMK